MKKSIKYIVLLSLIILENFSSNLSISVEIESKKTVPLKISIIVGSIRTTTTGKQIAEIVQKLLQKRSDVVTEILYVSDYHLPFYTDAASPASLKGEIVDPILKKWSDAIAKSSAFIIISPEYNGGYPAALKNALDSLYKEWNHKPVGIIGYSGGPSGGTSMIVQLKQVLEALEMISVPTVVKIPQSWKAFDTQGNLLQLFDIEKNLHKMVDELIKL